MPEVVTAPSSGAEAVPRRRRRAPWVIASVVVVALAVGIPTTVWFVHWRSSLHSLVDYPGYGVGIPASVAQRTFYFGNELVAERAISHPKDSGTLSINISSITPVVLENTANADVTVAHCVLARPGAGVISGGPKEAAAKCSSLTPFRSGSVTLGFAKGSDDIVIAVTVHKAGLVRIAGVEVHYSSGLRHGSQHTGAQLRIRTKG
jgi:hypothetical protein